MASAAAAVRASLLCPRSRAKAKVVGRCQRGTGRSGCELRKVGDGASRRRLIRLLSAGWLPPSVLSSRGFPLSRGRASGSARPHN